MDFYGPEYECIPRRSDGTPDYFILPSQGAFLSADGVFTLWAEGVRGSFNRKMAAVEAGWRKTKDPWFVAEGVALVTAYRQTNPAWLDAAVYAVATGRRTDHHARRARERAAHSARYKAVRDAERIDGLNWVEAYEQAAEVTGVSADTCAKSYKRVRKDLVKDPRHGYGLYAIPKQQNRKD
jgi:hypothetical protein